MALVALMNLARNIDASRARRPCGPGGGGLGGRSGGVVVDVGGRPGTGPIGPVCGGRIPAVVPVVLL